MDSRVAFVCVVLTAFAVVQTLGAPHSASDDNVYTKKYDHIDIEQILASKRLVNSYVQCLLDKKPCSPEGTELKKMLPDALKTQCGKCSIKQKNAALIVVERLQVEYPQEWEELLNKWDPKREILKKFKEYIIEEKKKGFTKF